MGTAALLMGCQARGRWKPLSRDELRGPIDIPPPRPRRDLPAPTPQELPGVISRREWASAGPNMALAYPMNGVDRITVHHDGMDPFGSTARSDAARRLESIRRAHTGQKWADIGYHYVIDPAGRIWEGRPVSLQGAHVKYNNEHNLGVMLLGNFEESRPTSEAVGTLDALLADLMRRHRVPLARVFTHREIMPTACPGRNLQGYMLATRASSGRLARA